MVLVAAAVLASAVATPVFAQEAPVREQRSILVAAALPDWLVIAGKDATVPLPGVRVGVNFLPALAVDLTAGYLGYEHDGAWSVVDVGLRWFLTSGALAPYLMARAGRWHDSADEGSDTSSLFAGAGGGIEFAGRSGFSAWLEAAPALVSHDEGSSRSLRAGVVASLGAGYRFGL